MSEKEVIQSESDGLRDELHTGNKRYRVELLTTDLNRSRSDDSKRKHKEVERERRTKINEKIEELKQLINADGGIKKSAILNQTIASITELTSSVTGLVSQHKQLKDENQMLLQSRSPPLPSPSVPTTHIRRVHSDTPSAKNEQATEVIPMQDANVAFINTFDSGTAFRLGTTQQFYDTSTRNYSNSYPPSMEHPYPTTSYLSPYSLPTTTTNAYNNTQYQSLYGLNPQIRVYPLPRDATELLSNARIQWIPDTTYQQPNVNNSTNFPSDQLPNQDHSRTNRSNIFDIHQVNRQNQIQILQQNYRRHAQAQEAQSTPPLANQYDHSHQSYQTDIIEHSQLLEMQYPSTHTLRDYRVHLEPSQQISDEDESEESDDPEENVETIYDKL